MPREIQTLLAALEEAYKGPAWHGPSLRASLSRVTAKQAAHVPPPAATTSGNLRFTPPTGNTPSAASSSAGPAAASMKKAATGSSAPRKISIQPQKKHSGARI